MRTFTVGSGADRKVVRLEVVKTSVRVIEGRSDGSSKRSEKALETEAQARAACEKMARALIERGYQELGEPVTASAPAPARRMTKAAPEKSPLNSLLEEDDGSADVVAPLMPRAVAASAPEAAPKKKKKKKKRAARPGDPAHGDGLDKKVVAAVACVGILFVGFLGFMAYDTFLKPASIVGSWKGSKLEYEISQAMSLTQYQLVLDDKKNAVLTLQEDFTSQGTYTLKGNRLTLKLKDEEGGTTEVQYKVAVGRATLDLYDPASGKKMVELLRLPDMPSIGPKAKKAAAPAGEVAAAPIAQGDKAADAKLASIEFLPKDAAFKLRHAPGWEATTGSRPDNTYSWVKLLKGSARIHVQADIAGSLMSGSDSAQPHEPGSELAPVHRAHELGKKLADEEYSDYAESKPTLFQGSGLGEGRIATFSGSEGGLFGSKLRGYRVTLLTNDRRVTIFCHAPDKEFAKLSPLFLAVCRSVAR